MIFLKFGFVKLRAQRKHGCLLIKHLDEILRICMPHFQLWRQSTQAEVADLGLAQILDLKQNFLQFDYDQLGLFANQNGDFLFFNIKFNIVFIFWFALFLHLMPYGRRQEYGVDWFGLWEAKTRFLSRWLLGFLKSCVQNVLVFILNWWIWFFEKLLLYFRDFIDCQLGHSENLLGSCLFWRWGFFFCNLNFLLRSQSGLTLFQTLRNLEIEIFLNF